MTTPSRPMCRLRNYMGVGLNDCSQNRGIIVGRHGANTESRHAMDVPLRRKYTVEAYMITNIVFRAI